MDRCTNFSAVLFALLTTAIAPALAEPDALPDCADLSDVLAHPAKYEGKVLHLHGYLHNRFEDRALYLHRDGQSTEALWIMYDAFRLQDSPDAIAVDNQYVSISGTLRSDLHGHKGCCAGALDNASTPMLAIEPDSQSNPLPLATTSRLMRKMLSPPPQRTDDTPTDGILPRGDSYSGGYGNGTGAGFPTGLPTGDYARWVVDFVPGKALVKRLTCY